MDFTTLAILIAAVWRLSSLLVSENGPFDIFDELRFWIGVRFDQNNEAHGTNEVAKVFTCIWCMSIWIAILITVSYAIIPVYTIWICLPFALSTGAILIDRVIRQLSS